MAVKYAKNPGEPLQNPAEFIIDNPSKSKKKRKNMKSSRKTNSFNKFQEKHSGKGWSPSKMAREYRNHKSTKNKKRGNMGRSNPEKFVDEGKSLLLTAVAAVGGGFAITKLLSFGTQKFGSSLPDVVKEFAPAVVPVLAGTGLGVWGGDSKILQDAGTGMVIGGVNNAFVKLGEKTGLDEAINDASLGGAMLGESQFVIDADDGIVRDNLGNPVAQVDEPELLLNGSLLEHDAEEGNKLLGDHYALGESEADASAFAIDEDSEEALFVA